MSKPSKPKSAYIETDTGNKVARRAQLHGTQHIVLAGRAVIQPDVCIRGDLVRPAPPPDVAAKVSSNDTTDPAAKAKPAAPQSTTAVSIGRYTFVSSHCVLRPPSRVSKGLTIFVPMKIGDHVFFDQGCIIEAASIGNNCHFGKGAVVGKLCVIKDLVKVLPGAVLPPQMVVPSHSVVGGSPARVIGEVGDGWGEKDGEGGELRDLWRATG